MRILNLTQHAATPDQVAAGVIDVSAHERELLAQALTFEWVPDAREIHSRCELLAELASTSDAWEPQDGAPAMARVMIGGAPWLMGPLAGYLQGYGLVPVFAFSRRVSMDQPGKDGTVQKVSVFQHEGFVHAIGMRTAAGE